MKIVYCTDSICYPGGIQTITIVKANALANIPGNEVWIVVTDNKQSPLKPLVGVKLVDLDVNYYDNDWRGHFYVIKDVLLKRKIHKKRLWKVLDDIRPDVVISTGTSEKNFLPSLKIQSDPVFIREIHSEKNYRKRHAVDWKDLLMAYVGDWIDYGHNIKKYHKIAVLTEEDRTLNWKGHKNVVVMPNPITADFGEQADCNAKVVVAAGRLVRPKNFISLIRCWKIVAEKFPDWRLEIWESGHQESVLKNEIAELNLKGKVFLMGYSSDIYGKMKEASIYVLSSVFEGFPLVLIEAMSVGLPVVSYSCPTGPKDIVEDGKNGFLVPVNDEMKMAEKICTLIEDENLRKMMGKEAFLSSKKYKIEVIAERWMNLFQQLIEQKKC